MDLNMHIITDEIKSDYNMASYLDELIELNIKDASLFDQKMKTFSSNTLYLIFEDDLTSLDGRISGLNFLCIGKLDKLFAARNCCNIICLDSMWSMTDLLVFIYNIHKKYDEWNNQFYDALISKKSLESLFVIASEIIQNPMMLLGPFQAVIYSTGSPGEDCNDGPWDLITQKRNASFDLPQYHIFSEVSRKYAGQTEPFIIKEPSLKNTYLEVNLFQGRIKCGEIFSIEKKFPFTLGQISLIFFFKKIIETAVEIVPELQILSANECSCIYQLLDHMYVEETIITNFFKSKKWNKDDFLYCLFFTDDESDEISDLNEVTWELKKIFTCAIILKYKKGLFLIQRDIDFNFSKPNIKEKLVPFVKEFSLTAGISSIFNGFTHFAHIGRFFNECSLAIQYGQKEPSSASIFFFEDYATKYLVQEIFTDHVEKQFLHTRIEQLYLFDLNNNTKFVETIYYYFLMGQSKTLTSEKMNLHRNSLIYRLDTIKNKFGIDLSNRFVDENEIFHILLTCLFLLNQDGRDI